MFNKVDDKDNNDFVKFDSEEDAPGTTDEQCALLASFKTVRRDQAG
jgi:hypothetical protein